MDKEALKELFMTMWMNSPIARIIISIFCIAGGPAGWIVAAGLWILYFLDRD